MTRKWTLGVFLAGSLGVLAAPSAQAASLQQVSNWNGGVTGLPSDVLMFVYKPDKVAANPPLLTLIHYCGGSAQAVFGQARGSGTTDGGIIQAADQFGFIIVVPSNANASGANGRCWDVSSAKAQKREGGGDPQAIYQMVKYALSQYHANADRVYSTGDSSGAMMTELLLALYPDVFKAGSTFAGVPAGCSNVFDGSGLCGLPAQTAQQWGDRVRAMDPGYTGHRPRVQLFHGDADGTITYKNMGEAIKEWTNVLGLDTEPTSTQSGFTLGTHQASRKSWKNACGYVVLDALTSIGGDHGPSDTLFVGKYVLPFLGLDSQAAVDAAVDPEVAQCGGDAGVTTGDGGTDAAKPDTASGGAGGSTGGGGSSGGRDGSAGGGGNSNNGGTSGTAGDQGTGGKATGGSQNGTGGASGTGGAKGSGGASTGGTTGNGSGGAQGSGGAAGSSSGGGGSNGCSCAVGGTGSHNPMGTGVLILGLALAILVRRRRNHQC